MSKNVFDFRKYCHENYAQSAVHFQRKQTINKIINGKQTVGISFLENNDDLCFYNLRFSLKKFREIVNSLAEIRVDPILADTRFKNITNAFYEERKRQLCDRVILLFNFLFKKKETVQPREKRVEIIEARPENQHLVKNSSGAISPLMGQNSLDELELEYRQPKSFYVRMHQEIVQLNNQYGLFSTDKRDKEIGRPKNQKGKTNKWVFKVSLSKSQSRLKSTWESKGLLEKPYQPVGKIINKKKSGQLSTSRQITNKANEIKESQTQENWQKTKTFFRKIGVCKESNGSRKIIAKLKINENRKLESSESGKQESVKRDWGSKRTPKLPLKIILDQKTNKIILKKPVNLKPKKEIIENKECEQRKFEIRDKCLTERVFEHDNFHQKPVFKNLELLELPAFNLKRLPVAAITERVFRKLNFQPNEELIKANKLLLTGRENRKQPCNALLNKIYNIESRCEDLKRFRPKIILKK